jgi:hypothetical protein
MLRTKDRKNTAKTELKVLNINNLMQYGKIRNNFDNFLQELSSVLESIDTECVLDVLRLEQGILINHPNFRITLIPCSEKGVIEVHHPGGIEHFKCVMERLNFVNLSGKTLLSFLIETLQNLDVQVDLE